MIYYIIQFVPSILGVCFYNYLKKEKSELKNDIIRGLCYVLLSTIIMYYILLIFSKTNQDISFLISMYSHYAARYGIISIVINLFLAFINSVIVKIINIEVSSKNEKNSR